MLWPPDLLWPFTPARSLRSPHQSLLVAVLSVGSNSVSPQNLGWVVGPGKVVYHSGWFLKKIKYINKIPLFLLEFQLLKSNLFLCSFHKIQRVFTCYLVFISVSCVYCVLNVLKRWIRCGFTNRQKYWTRVYPPSVKMEYKQKVRLRKHDLFFFEQLRKTERETLLYL